MLLKITSQICEQKKVLRVSRYYASNINKWTLFKNVFYASFTWYFNIMKNK